MADATELDADAARAEEEEEEEEAKGPVIVTEWPLAWEWGEENLPSTDLGDGLCLPPLIAYLSVDGAAESAMADVADSDDSLVKFTLGPRRLARSAPYQWYVQSKKMVDYAEVEYGEIKGETPKQEVALKEEKMKEIEELRTKVAEKEATKDEFKESLDATALASWKCALMAAAEGGLTAFMSAPKLDNKGYPEGLLGRNACSPFDDADTVIGAFCKQCEVEKEKTPIVITGICPATFRGPATDYPATISKAMARLQMESIPVCMLYWYDFSGTDYIEAVLAMSRLRKEGTIKALGLSGFPTSAVKKVLDTGIEIQVVSAPFSLVDQGALHNGLLPLCREHGIAFLATAPTAGGFLSARYHGAPPHSSPCPIVDWASFQLLLSRVVAIAQQHLVTSEAIALRWVIDQGAIPAVPITVTAPPAGSEGEGAAVRGIPAEGASACWTGFGCPGHLGPKPGYDPKLVAADTFLTKENVEALSG